MGDEEVEGEDENRKTNLRYRGSNKIWRSISAYTCQWYRHMSQCRMKSRSCPYGDQWEALAHTARERHIPQREGNFLNS